jgi:hypothetical protein
MIILTPQQRLVARRVVHILVGCAIIFALIEGVFLRLQIV